MVDQLLGLRVFVRVARTKSFSRAAKELRLSQPSVSRIVNQLEAELGSTLFSRSTRTVSLTDAGETYLGHVQQVLDLLDEANESVRETGELRGVLRIGASSIFASRTLLPRLERFMALHPQLRVDLTVDDERQNLVAEAVDVAFRFGPLKEATTVARKLRSWPIVLAASPAYLARRGSPGSPGALREHTTIFTGLARDGKWTLRDGTREVVVQIAGMLSVGASEVGLNAAVGGLGIVAATSLSFERNFEDGTLVRVLPGWTLGEIDAHAVYPGGQAVKASARAFTDLLVAELSVPNARGAPKAPSAPTAPGQPAAPAVVGGRRRGRQI